MTTKLSFFLILLSILLCFSEAFAQAEKQTEITWQKLSAHPRLFANNDKIASLKSQSDTVSKQLFALLKIEADKYLSAEKIVYPTKGFKLEAMREVQGRILALALAYRLFGEKKYLEKAKSELLQLTELPDWNPSHFLDVGEGALAAGIGLDWLYNELSPEERQKITQAIIKNALLPSLEVQESPTNSSWVNGTFNWNPVCHGGLTVAALAIAETEPDLSKQIIKRVVKYIPFAGADYAPDGSYLEGPSYWSYGTSFYVIAIEALRSVIGNSFELEKMPGFLKTADYKNQVLGTFGQEFNYSDYHIENLNEPIMFWFGRELKRSDLLKSEVLKTRQLLQQNNAESSVKKVFLNRHFPLEIIWWTPSLFNQSKTETPRHYTAQGGLALGVMRSSWEDPNASFIAIKGGTPNYSHGHMDVGSFVLEAQGVRWALDLGTESYDKMRAAKLDLWNYSQNSSRWTTFRVGAEGHNILRFDRERPQIEGKATIMELKTKKNTFGNALDLTSMYSKKAKKVERRIFLNADKSFSIQDEWMTNDNEVEVSWQWLTKAKVSKTGSGLVLEQEGKRLELTVEQPTLMKDIFIEVEDISEAKNVQDSPNPNLKRIVIKQKTGANSNGKLFVHIKSI